MSNETYWALKQREWAARQQRPTRRNRRLNVPLRGPQRAVAAPAAPIPAAEIHETTDAILSAGITAYNSDQDATAEEPSYRDLQAKAKELDIKANQPADKLKAAIEEAG